MTQSKSSVHRPKRRQPVWAVIRNVFWSNKNLYSLMFNQLRIHLAMLSNHISKLYPLREAMKELYDCFLKLRITLFLIYCFMCIWKERTCDWWHVTVVPVLLPIFFLSLYSLALFPISFYWHFSMTQLSSSIGGMLIILPGHFSPLM